MPLKYIVGAEERIGNVKSATLSTESDLRSSVEELSSDARVFQPSEGRGGKMRE